MKETVTLEEANAKINPYLRVLGRRDDGYHDIETLILPTTLHDEVTVTTFEGDELRLRAWGERGNEIPTDDENVALVAAAELKKTVESSSGVEIDLLKRIPVTAGLGGGSADAAATLRALDRAWELGLGTDGLVEIASRIGSDVPALLEPRPVIVTGRGDRLEAVKVRPTSWVLVTQSFGVSSADAYRWWDDDGGVTGPESGPLLEALSAGDVQRAGSLLFNDLEPPVSKRHPDVAAARSRLLDAGALGAIMSGSGPTVAGLARDETHAQELANTVDGMAVATL